MPFDEFSARFNVSDQSYLVRLKVQSDAVGKDKQAAIQKIVNQLIADGVDFAKNPLIRIKTAKNSAGVKIRVNREKKEFDTLSPSASVPVKIIHLAERLLPKRQRTLSEIEQSLYAKWPTSLPIASFFLALVVIPLARLISFFKPGQIFDTKSLKWVEDPHAKGALKAAMREVIEVLEQDVDPRSSEVVECFKRGLDFSEEWEKGNKPAAIGGFYASLRDGYQMATASAAQSSRATALGLIPGGYWSEGEYHPVQWIFTRSPEGSLCVHELGYGRDDGSMVRNFDFGAIDSWEDQKIQGMIDNLMKLSDAPVAAPPAERAELMGAAYVAKVKDTEGHIPDKAALAVGVEGAFMGLKSFEEYKESLFVEGGGKPLASEKGPKTAPILGEDPIKLLHETIRTQFPEAALQDKALFSLHFLHIRLTKILAALPGMEEKERVFWLHKLQADFASLQNQLAKSDLSIDITNNLEVFRKNIDHLQKELAHIEAQELLAQSKRLENLNQVAPGEFALQVKTDFQKIDAAVSVQNGGRLTAIDRQNIQTLRLAFVSSNPAAVVTVVEKLSQLTTRVDELVASHNYEAAIELYRAIQLHLPAPEPTKSVAEIDFWKLLTNHANADQVKAIAENLGKLSQYFWEAKVKTVNLPLKPDEWVYMLNSEAAMRRLLRIRYALLKQKAKESRSLEERAFMAVCPGYRPEATYGHAYITKFKTEMHLRPCENPLLMEKFAKIDAWFKTVSIHEEFTMGNSIFEKYYAETEDVKYILNEFGIPLTTENILALWHRYLLRQEPTDAAHPAVPTQFGDLSRHQIMYTSMLYATTSIARYGGSLGGLPQYLAGAIFTYQNPEEKQREQFLDAMRIVNGYQRLEIAPMRHLGLFVNWGIVPPGHNPGDTFSVAITPGGLTDVQMLINRTKPQSIHGEALGHPTDVVGSKFIANREWPHRYLVEQTEASLLSRTLASDSTAPLDDFVLATMKGGRREIYNNSKDKCYYQSVFDVFDGIIQRPWLLDRLTPNKRGIAEFEAQKRFYDVLFTAGLISKTLQNAPETFLTHAAPLRKILDRCLAQNKVSSFAFLLYLCQNVHHHVKLAIEKEPDAAKKSLLAEILETWPNGSHQVKDQPQPLTFREKAWQSWEAEKNFKQKIDGAAYYISAYSNHPDAWRADAPAGLSVEPPRDKEIVRLLRMGSLLEVAKDQATMPVIARQTLLWIKEHLAHYVDQLPVEKRDRLLNEWMRAATEDDSLSAGTNWMAGEGQPQVWKRRDATGETVVDLATLQILCHNGKSLKGTQVELPNEITQHADFLAAFGEVSFTARVRPDKNPGQFIYLFRDSKGNSYRILANLSTHTISIERKAERSWLRYCRPTLPLPSPLEGKSLLERIASKIIGEEATKMVDEAKNQAMPKQKEREPAGIEKELLKGGMWMDVNDRSLAYAFLGKNVLTASAEDRYQLSLDGYGRIKQLKSPQGLEVVHDPDLKLSPVLGALPKEQILFLKKPDSSAITQIRFLNQQIYLRRKNSQEPWQVRGDEQLDGAEWVMGADRGEAANTLLNSLGVDFEQIGFTVRKGNALHLITWPQHAALQGKGKHLKTVFNHIVHRQPPLKVKIDADGKVSSSAGGYMQLAYLFAVKHDYAKAVFYLQRARESKMETKEEQLLLVQLENHFKQMPVSSLRAAIIKLKGLLAVRQIFLEQSKRKLYVQAQWREFLASAQEIQSAFATYEEQLKTSPFAQHEKFLSKGAADVSFSGAELEELQHCVQESFSFLFSDSQRAASLTADKMKLALSVPSSLEAEICVPLLLIHRAPPLKHPEELLEKISLHPDCVIDHFFEIYNLIVANQITPDQLQPLFGAIPGLEKIDLKELQEKVKGDLQGHLHVMKIDIARRLLLAAACGKKQPLDLKHLQELQDGIPTSFISTSYKLLRALNTDRQLLGKKGEERAQLLAQSTDVTFARRLDALCKSIAPEADAAGKIITTAGFQAQKEATPVDRLGEALKQGKAIDLEKFKSNLRQNPHRFGPTVTPILLLLMEKKNFLEQLKDFQGVGIPVEKLLEVIEQQTKINLMEILREEEVKQRVMLFEKKSAAVKKVKIDFTRRDDNVRLPRLPTSSTKSFDALWSSVDTNRQANLTVVRKELQLLAENNADLLEGIEHAKEYVLHPMIDSLFTIQPDKLAGLASGIMLRREKCAASVQRTKNQLLETLKAHENVQNLPLNMQRVLRYGNEIGEEGILHELKKVYQSGELQDPDIVTLLTHYLLQKASLAVLSGAVNDRLETLLKLKEQNSPSTSADWISAATELHDLVQRAMNHSRYLDAEGYLLNGPLYRKVLLAEALQGIILKEEQITLIKQMVQNPCDWYELKVGLGKTSVVLPLVLMLLSEQGEFPVAMVKDELLQQNLDSLDRATRDLCEKAGVEFSFRLNDPVSPLILQEQYLKLLEVETNKGYPITSINSIIAIDQKLQLIDEQLRERVSTYLENVDLRPFMLQLLAGKGIQELVQAEKNVDQLQEHFAKLQEIEALQKEIYYLSKIKEKLHFILIDEADDVLNVICENNVGRGKPVVLDPTIQQTMRHIMRVIHTSKDELLLGLKRALQNRSPLTLDLAKEKLMPALAQALLQDREFLSFAPIQGPIIPLVAHLCTVFEKEEFPSIPQQQEETEKKLGALKRILQETLPTALMQNPGIDAGLKQSDGYQIGPQVSGREKQGTIFSDEHDLIVNHFLYYSMQLPEPLHSQEADKCFTAKGLKQIRDQYPDVYREWEKNAATSGEKIIAYLNREDNYEQRLQFLELQVIAEMKIKRFERQIVFNVQDICRGRHIGGMTGTLNRDCLPDTQETKALASDRAKKVVGQVLLEAGILQVPKVTIMEEGRVLEAMQQAVVDYNHKAILNQGFDLEKGDAKQVVAKLRKAAPARIFVFVDSDSRHTYIWQPGENKPEPISKPELNRLALEKEFKEKACFYFAPPDTRGTDFRIPPGKGVTFLSPKCSIDSFVQTLGRMRGAGLTHSMDFFVPTAVSDRIKGKIADLNYASIVEDIARQEMREVQGKSLKTAIQSLKTIVKMDTRTMLYGHQKVIDDNAYWSPFSPILRILNTYVCKQLTEVACDNKTGWLEEVKKVNLQKDFAPSVFEETRESLTRIYEAELDKVGRLENVLHDLQSRAQFLKFPGVARLDSRLEGWVEARKGELNEQLAVMKKDLEKAYLLTLAKLEDKQNQIYPQKIPSSGAGVPTAQAQVEEVAQEQQVQQQQAQQQEQTQQQMQSKKSAGAVAAIPAKPFLTLRPQNDPVLSDIFTLWDACPHAAGEVKFSQNFLDIFDLVGGIKGHLSLCRLAVLGNDVCIVTRQDLVAENFILEPTDAVYAFANTEVCGINLVCDCGDEKRKLDVLELIVRAKWFLGMDDYDGQERAILRKWLAEIESKEQTRQRHHLFLEKFGGPQQMHLMEELH